MITFGDPCVQGSRGLRTAWLDAQNRTARSALKRPAESAVQTLFFINKIMDSRS